MAQIVNFSEAAAIGIHAVLLLTSHRERALTTRRISERLGISDHHCAKVMQRLVHAGLVRATRGPGGGFVLAGDPAELTILMVFEAIEGKLEDRYCMFKVNKCPAGQCLFHELTAGVNRTIRSYLESHNLAELAATGALA
ncbi:MAG: Rrf2 family transcriptional regulator [Victivallales bacterium]|nr:Rrf2 family transcriptional regulator [Victivallales bacterium]